MVSNSQSKHREQFICPGRSTGRYLTTLALAALLLAPSLARAAPEISVRADAGGRMSAGISGLDRGVAWGLDLRLLWRVSPRVSLGLRQAVGFSVMQYTDFDGTPEPGQGSVEHQRHKHRPLGDALTVFPTSTFTAHLDLLDRRLGLDLELGMGLMAAAPMGVYSLVPHPVVAASAEVVLVRTPSVELGLHAGAGLLLLVWAEGTPVMAFPRGGVTARF